MVARPLLLLRCNQFQAISKGIEDVRAADASNVIHLIHFNPGSPQLR